mmetsp:Transcript_18089/g.37589  ORF Transcript_18089/g.37589 Transcript_18089/m.37589 type:complete len:83 (-) Transcript_18089:755-1003(-)
MELATGPYDGVHSGMSSYGSRMLEEVEHLPTRHRSRDYVGLCGHDVRVRVHSLRPASREHHGRASGTLCVFQQDSSVSSRSS